MWKKSSLEKLAIVPLIWSLDFIDFYFPKIPGSYLVQLPGARSKILPLSGWNFQFLPQ